MSIALDKALRSGPAVSQVSGCTRWQSISAVPHTVSRPKQQLRLMPIAAVATGPEDDGGEPIDLTTSFAEELQKRQAHQAAATEMESATDFDGAALLEVLLDRFAQAMVLCICVLGTAACRGFSTKFCLPCASSAIGLVVLACNVFGLKHVCATMTVCKAGQLRALPCV